MKRIFYFIATNIAVLVALGVVLNLTGLESILDERGVGIDVPALLGFSLVVGMGGSVISLLHDKVITCNWHERSSRNMLLKHSGIDGPTVKSP